MVSKTALQTFGKYQILDLIATGGMAEIYKAKLEGIGGFQRTFAIKRILPNLSQNSEYIAMLVDEAKVAGLLSHANIVQILDLGQVDGIWYIAMEYVDGQDLGGVLRRAHEKGLTLPVPHTVFVAIELLKGLEYAHGRQVMRGGRPVALNIIHRDVSPPNILLSFQGEVKLTDFGIARASLKAMETVSGIVKGRFDYMSPEQAAGSKDLDQRSDLFSVGVVLYEMLTGTHPFRTDNEIGTIERVRTGNYVPVSQRNPEVPYTLETIVDRALQVNREDRYPSATAFKEALDKFFHDAGFIFTHATLASYIKGLFPENLPRGARPAPKVEGRPERRNQPNVSGSLSEQPTGSLERKPSTDQTTRPMEEETASVSARHGSGIGVVARTNEFDTTASARIPGLSPPPPTPTPVEDQETMIRRMPTAWEEEIAGQMRPQVWTDDDEEQETVIRRIPDDETLERSISQRTHTISEPEIIQPTPRGTSSAGIIGGSVAALLMLFVGMFTGMTLTLLLAFAAGLFGGGSDMIRAQPVVRVVAPAGTSVTLNGDAVGTEFTVPAEGRQRIEVALDGHDPWSQEFSFAPGEYRVIMVKAADLKPAD
jgi:serine/threonine-protein kinase